VSRDAHGKCIASDRASLLSGEPRGAARLLVGGLAGALAGLSLAVGAPAQAASGSSTFKGRLELFHTDGKRNAPDTWTYVLKTKRGTYAVSFAHGVRTPRLGSTVALRGITLRDARRTRHILAKRVIGVSARTASAPTQNRKLAVILLNFQDNRTEPETPEQVRQTIWTGPYSVKAYFSEGSFGQMELGSIHNPDGDVYGYYTIPYDDVGCEYTAWSEAAMADARKAGVELNGYTNIMFLWPEAECGWAGAAYVGGSYSYMNGSLGNSNDLLAAHELGHNFGLYHAHSLICHDAAGGLVTFNPTEGDCRVEEYGDPYDRMGSGPHYEFNDYFKGVLGWWPASATVE